jgi:hypothetical protein
MLVKRCGTKLVSKTDLESIISVIKKMFTAIYNTFYKISSLYIRDNIVRRLSIRFINLILPILFIIKLKKPALIYNDETSIIVSMTTFPARIDKVWLVIESILHQTQKPDKILLWLYEGEFPDKNQLPKKLLNLEKRGLEIRFCTENIMPHNKYYHTIIEYPHSCVITIDDDIIYPPNLIEKFKITHQKYPKEIICNTTRKINVTNNKINEYKHWKIVNTNTEPSYLYLTMGVGGALYPPKSLDQEFKNINKIKSLSLKTDDLWLKVMSLKARVKVLSIAGEYPGYIIPIIFKNYNPKLMTDNIAGNNDENFQKLLEHYNISVTMFQE